MRVYAVDESVAQLVAEQGHEVALLDRSLDAVAVGDEFTDIWLIDLGPVDGLELVTKLLRRNPLARVVVVAHPEARDRIVGALLSGARSFLTVPGDVVGQLQRVLEDVVTDNGTPASFMERLVHFYELGTFLLRRQVVAEAAIKVCREMVRNGDSPNLLEAILRTSTVPELPLLATLDDGHKLVSMAFILMKTRKVSMQQLRVAFEFTKAGRQDLRWWIIELGFASPEDCDWTPPQPPPSGSPSRSPRGGGGPPGGAAAALPTPIPPPVDLYGRPRRPS